MSWKVEFSVDVGPEVKVGVFEVETEGIRVVGIEVGAVLIWDSKWLLSEGLIEVS